MSSSIPSPRFLIDENVRVELAEWLRANRFDVKCAPRSTADPTLAAWSKRDKRIIVTNDEDFCSYNEDAVYAVVWLRIPQGDPESLIKTFRKLLAEEVRFAGRLILLRVGKWVAVPLPERARGKTK